MRISKSISGAPETLDLMVAPSSIQRVISALSECSSVYKVEGETIGRRVPFDLTAMDTLLGANVFSRDHICVLEGTTPLKSDHLFSGNGRLNKRALLHELDVGRSFVVYSIHQFEENIESICRELTVTFGAGVEATLYATPPGGVGIEFHQNDASLLFQVHGDQQLKIRGGVNTKVAPGQPEQCLNQTASLSENEILCLPPGDVASVAIGDELSVFLSFKITMPGWGDLALEVMTETIQSHVAFKEKLPPRRIAGVSVNSDFYVEELQRRICESLSPGIVRVLLAKEDTSLLANRSFPCSDFLGKQDTSTHHSDVQLWPREGQFLLLQTNASGQQTVSFFGGEIEVSDSELAAWAQIIENPGIKLGDIDVLSPDQLTDFVQKMSNLGLLESQN